MTQCEAMTLSSAYSKAHRCLKKHGVKKVGTRFLCGHHQARPTVPGGERMKKDRNGVLFDDFLKEELKDPQIRKGYEAAKAQGRLPKRKKNQA